MSDFVITSMAKVSSDCGGSDTVFERVKPEGYGGGGKGEYQCFEDKHRENPRGKNPRREANVQNDEFDKPMSRNLDRAEGMGQEAYPLQLINVPIVAASRVVNPANLAASAPPKNFPI
ncbi:hypothetical protein AG1IA_03546 [Rhizoctonia solani AG-1 IA]|uniref:Uncharacterized protein n=1 Tax=Thanatephorus cucumeris (strain AG1-IA) TaxID=983506 RepID=L8WWQ3_THACA|nr:hypothetical protein AG1IA_03546 [Rhizoctonia solani AG-1 IA]